jgi:hypothetical protein
MALICSRCSSANPATAVFCHHDGAPLPGRAQAVNLGLQFPRPFVFPSGRQCHNFQQLAQACWDCWDEAKQLLSTDVVPNFLAGLGRADLAMAAREAVRCSDPNTGLDQFLDKIPNHGLKPAQVSVDPAEVTLTQLSVGQDRSFSLRIKNDGMKMLSGWVAAVDCPWLVVGDGAGAPARFFVCHSRSDITVQIRGQRLRAGPKPQEGRIVLDTNGGSVTVVVRVAVPIKPFPNGVLAGAMTPREVADKARKAPREAADLFEQGAVARWYEQNGWVYPVQGPAASGKGAVQQFFEALGLTAPPKVDISEKEVTLYGQPRAQLNHRLDVSTEEKRIVWANGVSDQAWLEVGRSRGAGQSVSIPLNVPAVPDRPGETLLAHVTVNSNGNQKFVVPVRLVIGGRPHAKSTQPSIALPPSPTNIKTKTNPSKAVTTAAPSTPKASETPASTTPEAPRKSRRWPHWIALVLVVLCFTIGLVHDLLLAHFGIGNPDLADKNEPRIGLRLHSDNQGDDVDKLMPEPTLRFGLVSLREKDPNTPGKLKRLTFDERGRSNNACLRIDGGDRLFGPAKNSPPGQWLAKTDRWQDEQGREHTGSRTVWTWPDTQVVVTQTVEVVRGEQSDLLDTCLVNYLVENRDTKPHKVGLRFLLDTFIGSNDGVPFTIPGASGLCDTLRDFDTPEKVPDFIQALENEDLKRPGTVAHLKLKLGGRMESPARVVLGAWPDIDLHQPTAQGQNTLWDVPLLPMKTLFPYDSAVTIYWAEQAMKPSEKREMGFTYGLGSVQGSGQLLMTVDGSFKPGGDLTVTVLVRDPKPNEQVTLTLPAGFEFKGDTARKSVPPPEGAGNRNSPVTWRLKAGGIGTHQLGVESSSGDRTTGKVTIRATSIFD